MADIPNSADEAIARLDMPLVDAMMTQRAVRRVLRDPVDDAIVLKCIELALRAPTGSNGQNWEFVVVKDRRVKEQLGRRYRQGWSVYGRIGRRVSAGDESMQKILRAVQWQVDHFSEIPVLVVGCLRGGTRVPYLPTPFVGESSYFGSIYPSAQNLLLAAINEHPGIGVSELARMERLRGPTISGHIKAMEAAGLVTRGAPDADDKRRVGLTVTGKGRRIIETLRLRRRDWLANQLSMLSPAGRRAIRNAIGPLGEIGQ